MTTALLPLALLLVLLVARDVRRAHRLGVLRRDEYTARQRRAHMENDR